MPSSLQCKFCYETDDNINEMISPCKCSGSIKYVHRKCLDYWRETSNNIKNRYICNQCKFKYKMKKIYLISIPTGIIYILNSFSFLILFFITTMFYPYPYLLEDNKYKVVFLYHISITKQLYFLLISSLIIFLYFFEHKTYYSNFDNKKLLIFLYIIGFYLTFKNMIYGISIISVFLKYFIKSHNIAVLLKLPCVKNLT